MTESDKPFTVSDRRHFTPEGHARADDAPAAEPDRLEAAPAAPQAERPPAENGVGRPGERRRPAAAAGPIEFGQFLVSLASQAGMLLSAAGQPEAEGAGEALDGARSIISILEMLEDKTRGRRTPDEDRLLEGILFELRMGYVERRRAVTP
jgi:hypothetical protein